jgi:aryl carrier-like protein
LCINALLLVVMMSSKNKRVFIWDLRELSSQNTFDAWWASMNVDTKHAISANNSKHAAS